MMGFAIAAFIVAIFIIIVWLMSKTIDGSKAACVALVVFTVFIFGVLLNIASKEDEKGPCHQYETQMMYNPATKTMMPSRICVLRGEWVKETPEIEYNQ